MTLRFNGQSPTSANGAFSAFPGRMYGTVSGIALQTGMIPLWLSNRAQTGSFGELAGQVDGTTDPVTWLMALQPGRIQSPYNQATFELSNTLIAGLPGSGSASITFSVGPSQLQLIVSAVGSTSITFTLTGGAAAVLQAVGAITATFTVGPATLGAESGVFGSTTFTFTATATPKALGNISGAVTPFTELSPQSLANAVWSALAVENDEVGSMGELLNSAGSAADPLLGIVEDTLTLRDVMRLILAVNAGDATGLESGTMSFRSQDGTIIRVQASYSSGARTITTIDPS